MQKKIIMLTAFTIIAGSAFSQTAPAIDKSLKDPKRAENAAKADVYVQKNKVIADSVAPTVLNANTVKKKKKSSCRRNASN